MNSGFDLQLFSLTSTVKSIAKGAPFRARLWLFPTKNLDTNIPIPRRFQQRPWLQIFPRIGSANLRLRAIHEFVQG